MRYTTFYHTKRRGTIRHIFMVYGFMVNMYRDNDLVSRQKIALDFVMQLPGRYKPQWHATLCGCMIAYIYTDNGFFVEDAVLLRS